MKILSAKQVRKADEFTINNEPISSLDLMERASRAFTDWFVDKFPSTTPVAVVSGPGNNGGDGLAIARLLLDQAYSVQPFAILDGKQSADFRVNFDRLSKMTSIGRIEENGPIPDYNEFAVIIEGIFGSGLSRPAAGIYEQVITAINDSSAQVVAIDIPSGLFADQASQGAIVRADYTLSFQVPKLAFVTEENYQKVGNWHLLDIGLDKDFISDQPSPFFYQQKQDIKQNLKLRPKSSHKGDYGRVLLVAGSLGKMGAAVLCGRASLKAGAGLLTVHVPARGYEILQTTLPEAMASVDASADYYSQAPELSPFDTIAIGPGIGLNKHTVQAFAKLLEAVSTPMVIDADAINILAANRELLQLIPQNSILTPHPKEFERLAGAAANGFKRLDLLREFAQEYKLIVALKGPNTAIAFYDGTVIFNSTGNAGMATAGSGDVLTGIITGLLARKYKPQNAATMGVYVHGYAGDLAASEMSQEALIASDITDCLGKVFKKLYD